jgi:hypothetical protein
MSDREIGDLEDISVLVNRLDALIPRNNANLKLEQYGGGPDESRIIGTQNGYLRLGIEFMRAAIAPKTEPKERDFIEVDLGYLISEDSDVGFDSFERVENFSVPSRQVSIRDRIIPIVMIALFIGFCFCAVVGIATIIGWAMN